MTVGNLKIAGSFLLFQFRLIKPDVVTRRRVLNRTNRKVLNSRIMRRLVNKRHLLSLQFGIFGHCRIPAEDRKKSPGTVISREFDLICNELVC